MLHHGMSTPYNKLLFCCKGCIIIISAYSSPQPMRRCILNVDNNYRRVKKTKKQTKTKQKQKQKQTKKTSKQMKKKSTSEIGPFTCKRCQNLSDKIP